ncbi:keratin, type I cytoskeletal 18-like [Mastacembelus armatus]|uniref:Keratin, type I cytoskeletal 18-like n=1 Tax=Mastacembelus armatus TaxID=205130 RepID=A0A3Q3NIG9_9TELE|nr:keratin, type I cytoskeletal 18-like [Mastacembelus armatus]
MPSNSAATVYGGARSSRPSVANLEGLRNVLRNETERDSPSAPLFEPANQSLAPDPLGVPQDDGQKMRGLNTRLSEYLRRVKQLQEENDNLQKQIDDILAKRKIPEGRKWDEMEKPLDELIKQIKDITMDNASLLLKIENTKLINEDWKKKLDNEKKAIDELEKELDDWKKTMEDTKLNCEHTKKEIELVKEELDRLKQEHKDDVVDLREKITSSEVKVEIDSQNSNLPEIVSKIRQRYEMVAEKNLKETEEWYQSKFETIKVAEAQNTEAVESGKAELKDLSKKSQTLATKIQSLQSTLRNLEDVLENNKLECGQRLGPFNRKIEDLQRELEKMRSQVEQQVETNRNLLGVKMKLEEEINKYRQLMQEMSTEADRLTNG